ncbi:hypothetical protein [Peribacillus glennii]|uniref:hypothetical protein n=1 Tax=Peribacillus glennii TaxID=2303991 RepID=UPI001F23D224|nr:hypothetical protein [Peribacillus glennii]
MLNGAMISFRNKKKNEAFTKGLNKDVKYTSALIGDEPITSYDPKRISPVSKARWWVNFDQDEKEKKVYAVMFFFDKDKKVIGHQSKTLTVKKLEVKYTKSIKKMSNKNMFSMIKRKNTYTRIFLNYQRLHIGPIIPV